MFFPVALYGRGIWFLLLKKEHRLRMFEDRILSNIFGPKREEIIGTGENYMMSSFIISLFVKYN
jgi:hypothetical protein